MGDDYKKITAEQTIMTQAFKSFDRRYSPYVKWWHSFSPFAAARRLKYQFAWINIVSDLQAMREAHYVNGMMEQLAISYNAAARMKKNNTSSRLIDVRELDEIIDLLHPIPVKHAWDRAFRMIMNPALKGHPYDRLFLYIAIGFDDESLPDYIDMPYSFLLQIASSFKDSNIDY